MRRILVGGIAALALAVTGACGGDGDDATLDDDTTETADDDDVTEFCELAAEFGTGTPSQEDVDRLLELAPEEVKDDVEIIVESGAEGTLDSAEAQAATENLDAWGEDNCS